MTDQNPQNNTTLKAAQLREQEGLKALRDGDRDRARENFRKAAVNYLKGADLEGGVRCLAETGELTSSLGQLLGNYDPNRVVALVRNHLRTGFDFSLCSLAAANVSGDMKHLLVGDILLRDATRLVPEKAVLALKGAGLAMSWKEDKDAALSVARTFYSLLNRWLTENDRSIKEEKLVLDSIIVLQAVIAMTDDLSLFGEIDRLQMRYLRLVKGRLEENIFVRSMFPVFIARGRKLDELMALADESAVLRRYANAYRILGREKEDTGFDSMLGGFEEKVGYLECKPDASRQLVTWAEVAEKFYDARYFMPERLSVRVISLQYQTHTQLLDMLGGVFSEAVDSFQKKDYEKSLEMFLEGIDSEGFSSLPIPCKQGAIENAARAAYEIENWDVFDRLCSRLEEDFNLKSVVQAIIED